MPDLALRLERPGGADPVAHGMLIVTEVYGLLALTTSPREVVLAILAGCRSLADPPEE